MDQLIILSLNGSFSLNLITFQPDIVVSVSIL